MVDLASDATLLERFAKDREEAAFVVLVERHGPRVQRVCRRILRNEQDVEDVFQATFLTLARKASLVDWQDSVGGWLSAVAHRLAMHTRSGMARQRGHEVPIAALGSEWASEHGQLPEQFHPLLDAEAEIDRRDLRRVLDDELLRLPEKYRAPVVLCYLEGCSHEEAAEQLGWPTGSMSRRLDRARTLLRQRLAHRGFAMGMFLILSAAMIAVGIGRSAGQSRSAIDVRRVMLPFRTVSEGGQGFGPLLSTLIRDDVPGPDPSEIVRLARQTEQAARLLESYNPGPLRKLWHAYSQEMATAAMDLEHAALVGDRLALVAVTRKLDSSCVNCHDIFR